jgi:hypothetical protein
VYEKLIELYEEDPTRTDFDKALQRKLLAKQYTELKNPNYEEALQQLLTGQNLSEAVANKASFVSLILQCFTLLG